MPEEMPVEVTLEASGDQPSWLQLDRERLHIRGTAPLVAANQTYQLSVRAHTAQGSDSRLLVLLTITGQPDRSAPVQQLPGHWTLVRPTSYRRSRWMAPQLRGFKRAWSEGKYGNEGCGNGLHSVGNTVYGGQLSGHERLFPPEDMERWQERDERSDSAQ